MLMKVILISYVSLQWKPLSERHTRIILIPKCIKLEIKILTLLKLEVKKIW